jgi:serine/threonine protein kinase
MSYRRLEDCYDVGDLLGKGGFSRVFKGMDRKTHEEVSMGMTSSDVVLPTLHLVRFALAPTTPNIHHVLLVELVLATACVMMKDLSVAAQDHVMMRSALPQVALKMIPSKVYAGNEWARQLLRTEVRVMTEVNKLGHPNLIRFHHVFEDSHKVVIVLELLSGK